MRTKTLNITLGFLILSACAAPPTPVPTATHAVGNIVLAEISTAPHSNDPRLFNAEVAQSLEMSERRASHSATLLNDGQVLLAGGFVDDGHGAEHALASAELFNPTDNSFSRLPAMHTARSEHTATLLPDGQVLVVGGWGDDVRLNSAELYNPNTAQFTALNSLRTPRANHTATLLADGRVLVAGGSQARNQLLSESAYYNPSTHQFTPGAKLLEAREIHSATRLMDGRVLLVGGTAAHYTVLRSAEIFDPATGVFTATGSLHQPRYKHAAALLPDGRVLILGGSDEQDWDGQYLSTEIYDPTTGRFTIGPNLNGARFKLAKAVTLLNDGRVFIGGGNSVLEIFDFTTDSFTAADALGAAYYASTVTPLADGRVLIAGGYTRNIVTSARAWLVR